MKNHSIIANLPSVNGQETFDFFCTRSYLFSRKLFQKNLFHFLTLTINHSNVKNVMRHVRGSLYNVLYVYCVFECNRISFSKTRVFAKDYR